MSSQKLDELLTNAVRRDASDIHLKAGIIPVIRRHGRLRPLAKGLKPLASDEIESMILPLMNKQQRQTFENRKDVDLSHGIRGVGRFRINAFLQRGTIRAVIRHVPTEVPTVRDLALPPIIEQIANIERGLVLVTGVTGSGKSSTIAAMVNQINLTQNLHIVTIEDPVEFLIRDRKSIISQREVGIDTQSFSSALRSALRQDPDVILIGEMRDQETIEIALSAAETGHLVLSTLHTADTKETINRILSVFESTQQYQIRFHLAATLKAVISQRLVRRTDGRGFIPAVEIMLGNTRVRELIEKPERTSELKNVIEESANAGMQSFDQSLMHLLKRDLISYEEAVTHASNPEDFALRYSGISDGREWEQQSENGQSYLDAAHAAWEHVPDISLDNEDDDDSSENTDSEYEIIEEIDDKTDPGNARSG